MEAVSCLSFLERLSHFFFVFSSSSFFGISFPGSGCPPPPPAAFLTFGFGRDLNIIKRNIAIIWLVVCVLGGGGGFFAGVGGGLGFVWLGGGGGVCFGGGGPFFGVLGGTMPVQIILFVSPSRRALLSSNPPTINPIYSLVSVPLTSCSASTLPALSLSPAPLPLLPNLPRYYFI